jgi:transposase-like protein
VPRTRPPYPPEFKAEAIRFVKTSGDPIRQIAKDLGVSDQTLRNWVKQDRGSTLRSATPPRISMRISPSQERRLHSRPNGNVSTETGQVHLEREGVRRRALDRAAPHLPSTRLHT